MMRASVYQYQRRFVPLLLSLGVLGVLWWLTGLSPRDGIPALIVGLVLGTCVGSVTMRRMTATPSRARPTIVYVTDHPLYLVLEFLAPAPGDIVGMVVLAGLLIAWVVLLPSVIIAIAGTCLGYHLIVLIVLRDYERRHGPLRMKTFYTRSRTGQEGMIGKKGVVVRACAPKGAVRVGAELWTAVSATAEPIPEGGSITVCDIEGLTVFVECTPMAGT
jgi:membrane protein implicated in regulation of membrane protease activity